MNYLNYTKMAILALTLIVTFGCEDDPDNEGNHLPTVKITSGNQVVNQGATVNLSATAIDVDGDSLTYLWTMKSKPSGSDAQINNSRRKNASFEADKGGNYIVAFKANDGLSDSHVKTAIIKVSSADHTLTPTHTPILKEDCISHDLSKVKVIRDGSNWTITDGRSLMFAFKDKDEADRSLEIIKHYKMDKSCYVGRPNPNFRYMLVNNKSPENGIADEDCIGFNLNNIEVKKIGERYKIVEGYHYIFDFEDKKDEADKSLAIIKKYGFTQTCYVGRPDPDFSYLRKGVDIVPVKKVYKISTIKHYSSREDKILNYTAYTYNDEGDLVKKEQGSNPEHITRKYILTYDENHNLIKEEDDDRNDGTINNITTYTYDNKGNRLTKNYDYYNTPSHTHGADGIADKVNIYTYDENGNMLSDKYDNRRDGDHDIDEILTYTYDSNNNRLTYAIDYHADGTPDNITYYTYDENNNLIKSFDDDTVPGNSDHTKFFINDTKGNNIRIDYDNKSDGTIDRVNNYTYDIDNNQIKRTIDFENDGEIDSMTIYKYDEHRNQIKVIEKDPKNGKTKGVIVKTWIEI